MNEKSVLGFAVSDTLASGMLISTTLGKTAYFPLFFLFESSVSLQQSPSWFKIYGFEGGTHSLIHLHPTLLVLSPQLEHSVIDNRNNLFTCFACHLTSHLTFCHIDCIGT